MRMSHVRSLLLPTSRTRLTRAVFGRSIRYTRRLRSTLSRNPVTSGSTTRDGQGNSTPYRILKRYDCDQRLVAQELRFRVPGTAEPGRPILQRLKPAHREVDLCAWEIGRAHV